MATSRPLRERELENANKLLGPRYFRVFPSVRGKIGKKEKPGTKKGLKP
jgi:hypothetical protein